MKTLDIGKVYSLRTATGFSLIFTPSESAPYGAARETKGALDVPGHGTLPCVLWQSPDRVCIVTYPPLHEQHRTIEDITPFVALTDDT